MNPIHTSPLCRGIARVTGRLRMLLLTGALSIAGFNLVLPSFLQAKDNTPAAEVVPVRLNVDVNPVKRDGRVAPTYAAIVKQVAPSVVQINTKTASRQSQRGSPLDEFFRRYFGDEFPQGGPPAPGRMPKQQGLGSGVIVTREGYVLTNNHVVEGADEITVGLTDGRDFTARIVGTDPRSDIAVLKIEGKDLPYSTLSDSDLLEIGDIVLAIGNPFGLGQTVTMGIISAKGRSLPGLPAGEDFVQTDAAINPGNSGGALVDSEGRLVGINTAILSRTGGNLGIGFAVPINLARFVMESIVKDGRVVRGYMGVMPQDVNAALAKQFGLSDTKGALVAEVTPDGPADTAGVRSGDVIVRFADKPVDDSRSLRWLASSSPPGTRVKVKVQRDGSSKELEVKLAEFPAEELASGARKRPGGKSHDPLDGVTVADLDRETRAQFGIPSTVKGALVVQLDPDCPSAEAGLQRGDIVLEINRQPVRSADEAVALSENIKEDTVLLKVWSRGSSRFLVVDHKKK